MICIPYIINDNYKIARLGGCQSSVPYYIIESRPNSSKIRLFEFEDRFYAFDPEIGMGVNDENDYIFDIVKDLCSVKTVVATHTAEIVIALKKSHVGSSEPQRGNFSKNGLSVRGNQVLFDLNEVKHSDKSVSTIIVKIIDADSTGEYYSFGINVTLRKNIYDIVIDFGSEASQIWIFRRSNVASNQGNQMPLFNNIKMSDPRVSGIKDEEIYQYDKSSKNLFRSLFFINNEIKKDVIERNDLTFINEEKNLLTILKDSVALPNLKLMEHDNVNLPNFIFNGTVTNIYSKSDEIRAEILKFFFDAALKSVEKLAGKEEVACKLTFLVPNTYNQSRLSEVCNQLISDVDSLSTASSYPHIKKGIEVTTFSESDASFFGWYHASDFNFGDIEKRIMVIDIGKGTTDFSVLCIKGTDGRVTVERNARSGFVGAGNVMTFAILVSVLKLFADKLGSSKLSDVYDVIQSIAYSKDYAIKNQLYNYLETLKRNEPILGRTTLKEFINSYKTAGLTNIKSVDIPKLNDILKEACIKNCYVSDDDPVVLGYSKLMAEKLVRELRYVYDKSNPIDKVVFAGRGAKSKSLADAIKTQLKQFYEEREIVFVTRDDDVKVGCLKGPLNQSLDMDHMNMTIVGWPKQMNPQTEEYKDEKECKKKVGKTATKETNSFIKMAETLVSKLLDGDSDDDKTSEQVNKEIMEILQDKVRKKVIDTNPSDMSDIQGQPVNVNEAGKCFVLGNRRCFLKGSNRNILGRKHIFFDGYDFVLRDANSSFYLEYEENESDSSFITETFFPMTEDNGADISMPKVMEVLLAASPDMSDDDFTADNDTFTASEKGVANYDDDDFTA